MRLVLTILLTGVFVACAAANAKVLISFLTRQRTGSMLPLLGGVAGVGAAVLSPFDVMHKLWWMALLLDAGTVYWSVSSLLRRWRNRHP